MLFRSEDGGAPSGVSGLRERRDPGIEGERGDQRHIALTLQNDVGGSHLCDGRQGLGVCSVLLEQRAPARLPSLEEVQKRVAADLSQERRRQANEAYYQSLRQRYEIIGA